MVPGEPPSPSAISGTRPAAGLPVLPFNPRESIAYSRAPSTRLTPPEPSRDPCRTACEIQPHDSPTTQIPEMTSDDPPDAESESDIDDSPPTVPGPDERCGATNRRGEPCKRWPTKDEDGNVINGRCPRHGGKSTGPPRGSANYFKHGATATPMNLIENDLLAEEDVAWIEALRDAYLQEADFGPESPKTERLMRTCVMIFQEWSAQEHILEEGLAVDDVVGVNDSYEFLANVTE